MSNRLFVIGVGAQGLNREQRGVLSGCGLIVGSDRHMPLVDMFAAEKAAITPLADVLIKIRETLAVASVGVLASGDPLFYGIGRRLLDTFGPKRVALLPGLSSMQEACARFKTPWDDAHLVSLHGRECVHLPGLLLRKEKTFVFTDRTHSPDRIAARLLAYLESVGDRRMARDCRVQAAENIGMGNERLVSGPLAEIAAQRFADLSVMLLTRPALPVNDSGGFGLVEQELSHSRGLITKDEVRAVALHALRLPREGIMWDIGAGSGSVSIEAARMYPGLTVYSVERRDEEIANIKENIRRFGCYNMVPVAGEAPGALRGLPGPDRVFVGGSGGRLDAIISMAARRLPDNGRLVMNGVLQKTVGEAPKLMRRHGLTVSMARITCERTACAEGTSGKVLNPITVMKGIK